MTGPEPPTPIAYASEPDLSTDEYIEVLTRSTLAERRPVDDPCRIAAMLANADLIVTARAGDLLVGASRAITDFSYCTYLSDLAVDQAFQRRGIGRRAMELLIDYVRALPNATEMFVSYVPAPDGPRDFYAKLGFVDTGREHGGELEMRLALGVTPR